MVATYLKVCRFFILTCIGLQTDWFTTILTFHIGLCIVIAVSTCCVMSYFLISCRSSSPNMLLFCGLISTEEKLRWECPLYYGSLCVL